jgi:hypothetical protein
MEEVTCNNTNMASSLFRNKKKIKVLSCGSELQQAKQDSGGTRAFTHPPEIKFCVPLDACNPTKVAVTK